MSEETLLQEGYRRSREITRTHARSFHVASHLLFGRRRRAAFALYAVCRGLDDLVDEARAPVSSTLSRLSEARGCLGAVFNGDRLPERPLWDVSVLAAFRDTVRRFAIPEDPFQQLITGMEMDLVKHRYATWAELELYCHRVAGVVGRMLAPVLGCEDEAALSYAEDLGKAMQLTNILRDVGEDLSRGRVYLPEDELRAFGFTADELVQIRVDARWREFMRLQIERARSLYRQALLGVPALGAFGAGSMVSVMAALYEDILTSIEGRGFDVFAGRAVVQPRRRAVLVAKALLTPLPRRFAMGDLPVLPTAATQAGPKTAEQGG